MAQAFKRRPLTISDTFSLRFRLEVQLGYLVDCYGFLRNFVVDISSVKQDEGTIAVEGSFRCIESSRTVKEGRFRALLDERFNLLEFSITPASQG